MCWITELPGSGPKVDTDRHILIITNPGLDEQSLDDSSRERQEAERERGDLLEITGLATCLSVRDDTRLTGDTGPGPGMMTWTPSEDWQIDSREGPGTWGTRGL